jgi:DNA-binding response OmpR family regulator
LRVAVVHPKSVIRSLIARPLSESGFEPVEAATVADALAVLATAPPLLAIVDEELVGQLTGVRIPVIALGRRDVAASLVDAGACCVVENPFQPEALLRAVRWVLEVYSTKR